MDKVIESLDALTVEELEAVKAKVAALLKQKKEEAKEEAKLAKEASAAAKSEAASEKLKKDVEQYIVFTLKGQTRKAKVEKFTDKTVTVKLPEGVRYIKLTSIVDVVGGALPEEAAA